MYCDKDAAEPRQSVRPLAFGIASSESKANIVPILLGVERACAIAYPESMAMGMRLSFIKSVASCCADRSRAFLNAFEDVFPSALLP